MKGLRALIALLLTLPIASQKQERVPPLMPPRGALSVYHLGHSLVGRDMPHMLAQLAGAGHRWNSQLGWGSPLKAHWEPAVEIAGFDESNDAPAFRDAKEAIGSGDYDAVVLTEMVELRAAIRYFDGASYLSRWADLARRGSESTVVYLYETWHPLDDPAGWLERIHRDLDTLWLGNLAGPDSRRNPRRPIYLIPGGQALASVVQSIESGGIEGLRSREDLFARTEQGELDPIHINDLGVYVIALTHYSVLYQRSPVGLPHRLLLADGTPAQAFTAGAAQRVQEIVWAVVSRLPRTGIRGQAHDREDLRRGASASPAHRAT